MTKYQHACFMVEEGDQALIVDPGNFTDDLIVPENVVGVVVTHSHGDHLSINWLEKIVTKNPEAVIIGHNEVLASCAGLPTRRVATEDNIDIGTFKLRFYGDKHAIIHDDLPPVANLGVMINNFVYYPGDSFVQPGIAVDTLVLPVGAPWLKISEAIDFARQVAPRVILPTHDKILSNAGKNLVDNLVSQLVPSAIYRRLQAADGSVELASDLQ